MNSPVLLGVNTPAGVDLVAKAVAIHIIRILALSKELGNDKGSSAIFVYALNGTCYQCGF